MPGRPRIGYRAHGPYRRQRRLEEHAAVGGGAGILLAKLFTLGGDPTGGFFPAFRLPGYLPPAIRATRLPVTAALRDL